MYDISSFDHRKEIETIPDGDCSIVISHAPCRGYPRIRRDNVTYKIHRYVWIQKNGDIPDGMVVRHTCDNPKCVNLDHLLLGTPRDNINDMLERNRQRKGADINTNKLTEAEVLEIRKIGRSKTIVELGKMFNVTHGNISMILRRATWKHI